MAKTRDCPCFSGERYATCCGPFHLGDSVAPTPEALMRSRFSAFALGRGDYLVATLEEGHPDRGVPDLARALARVRDAQRFLGLRIVDATMDAVRGEGTVLFVARIFERGRDRSFAELSDFVMEGDAWKYSGGVTASCQELPEGGRNLDRASFLAVTAQHR